MPRILPGPPTAGQGSLARALRHGRLYFAYITCCDLYILDDRFNLIQAVQRPFDDGVITVVAFDRRCGGLAIACERALKIYNERSTYIPGQDDLDVRWDIGYSTTLDSNITALSWGIDREILVGSDHLSLYHPQRNELIRSWLFILSQPAKFAQFSPDANLIASYGSHDRLVKVWRRLTDRVTSTGITVSDFDFDYLLHPAMVEEVKWRQPFHEDLLVDNIIYSIAADGAVRIWASDVPHDSHILTLHEVIESEADQGLPVVLDDDVFAWALTKSKTSSRMLLNIAVGQPEIALVFGIDGTMKATALYNLGTRNHKLSSQKLFYEVHGLSVIRKEVHSWISVDVQRSGTYDLLFFVGGPTCIEIYEVKLDEIFTSSAATKAFHKVATLSGHSENIRSLQLSTQGLSSTASDTLRWTVRDSLEIDYAAQAAYTNRHSVHLPSYIPRADKFAALHDLTAVVRGNMLEIWADMANTPFTNAPEFQYKQAGITNIQWIDQEHLVICTDNHIQVLSAQFSPDLWTMTWQESTSMLSGSIAHLACTESVLVVAVRHDLLIYSYNTTSPTKILPLYHPNSLSSLLCFGYPDSARLVLSTLHDQMMSSTLTSDLGLSDTLFHQQKSVAQKANIFDDDDPLHDILPRSKVDSLVTLLESSSLLEILEAKQILQIARMLMDTSHMEASLDAMGLRFYQMYLLLEQKDEELTMREVMWASSSEKQDILVNLVKVTPMTWAKARASKAFLWLSDHAAILSMAEAVAQGEFLKSDDRDPVAASIWYLAMQKKNVLLGLWRMSGSHPEHTLTTRILANDFETPKWKTTAMKNAYALLGKRRYEYAAAWFLLAGSVRDAVNVCVRNVGDIDLAIAIARINNDKTVLEDLIGTTVVAQAKEEGDRFLACWCQYILSQDPIQPLIEPLSANSKHDPYIFTIYKQLRLKYGPHALEGQFQKYISSSLIRQGQPALAAQILFPLPSPSLLNTTPAKPAKLAEAPQSAFVEPTLDNFPFF